MEDEEVEPSIWEVMDVVQANQQYSPNQAKEILDQWELFDPPKKIVAATRSIYASLEAMIVANEQLKLSLTKAQKGLDELTTALDDKSKPAKKGKKK